MIIVRFVVRAAPGMADELATTLASVVEPSRALPGVIHLDMARDVTDPDVFVATEVYEDRAALDRQMALPEVIDALAAIRERLAADRGSTIYRVSGTEEW